MEGNDYDKLRALIAQNAIARNLGVTPQAVNQWFSKSTIPARFVLRVCEVVAWKVTPHGLRPDLYPHPEDGIPNLLRKSLNPNSPHRADGIHAGDKQ
ncbi:TPA: transcriptional regulator [Escherichia coli]|uniref:transcriptional regulator n=1 Tax=Escherichia coli TaxID=562 RepID=UPI00145C1021|nr:YdaS family helix-turn-helix protein [Escherichia coli]EFB1642972.1 helix-turn-helix domain-containing protein [Escherichia coli]EFH3516418.1 Cro/Cl family transcriptional regulator [Escherichia coli]EFK5224885.1 helix-turn-helix domain-containing protein [Escherichia coli]EHH7637675.1 helix-turn-helix domain-containing protein [Escherichia coli]EHI1002407.1 helix-turn-helix domain-containing protein [Escherichia coli]